MRAVALFATLVLGCVEVDSLGSAESEVIGGQLAAPAAFPAVGALHNGSVTCTATLIAADAIVTAAHCLPSGLELPRFTLDRDARGAVSSVALAVAITHPEWDRDRAIGDGASEYFDLAVARLATPIAAAAPMVLPSAAEGARLFDGTMVTLVGYGETIDGDPSSAGQKMVALAPIVDATAAELAIARPGDAQNCYGDSGGPGVVDIGTGPRLMGVVSRGATTAPTCDQGGVHTRVDHYVAWIVQHVPEACVGGQDCAGGVEPPPIDRSVGFGADISGGCAAAGGHAGGGAVIAVAIAALVARRRRRAIE